LRRETIRGGVVVFGIRFMSGPWLGRWLASLAAAAGLTGCTSVIVPPMDPADPVTVYLFDYGRHSSLALPTGDERVLVEYTYGDWDWFVLSRTGWHDVFPTLGWPTQGALGRRPLRVDPTSGRVVQLFECEEVLEITVSRDDASELAVELGRRFDERIDSVRYQPAHELTFVHADEAFHAFHNCNHVVAEWLRTTGCQVRGPALFADFEVRRANGAEPS
jgi:hypothetical protein